MLTLTDDSVQRLIALAILAAFMALMATSHAADFPKAENLPEHRELPNPLIMRDGTRVESKEAWEIRRRPELKALFSHYMYGEAPPAPDKVTAKVDREDTGFLGGKATLKEISLRFGPAENPPIHLLLVVPNGRKGPAATFVGLNFYGNHTTTGDPKVALPTVWVPDRNAESQNNKATEAGRGSQADAWAIDTLVDRGYALATFYSGDVAPDHPGHADGIAPNYPGYDWGNVRIWAWGASRVLDYLVTNPDIDAKRVAVIGHSRLGKAALVAGAFDERFAIVFSHQAGCGGSAPSRGTVGESVERINTHFPHWFNAEFKTFNAAPIRLPFDQNDLAALVAPRPLLFSNAEEDTWANPEGQFQVLRAAEPAYQLLGAGGLDAKTLPALDTLVNSTLGYFIRPGKHSMTRHDWTFFLDFADKHFPRKP